VYIRTEDKYVDIGVGSIGGPDYTGRSVFMSTLLDEDWYDHNEGLPDSYKSCTFSFEVDDFDIDNVEVVALKHEDAILLMSDVWKLDAEDVDFELTEWGEG